MIKLNDLQEGDIVMAEYEGQQWEGVVTELNHEDKEICVKTEIQAFWFTEEHLFPVTLDEGHLTKLGFLKQTNGDGSAKYMKEAFRLVVPDTGDFFPIEMWYREDRRLFGHALAVHELQNHYYAMTKVELNAVEQ